MIDDQTDNLAAMIVNNLMTVNGLPGTTPLPASGTCPRMVATVLSSGASVRSS
jgi:hypothetical protein